MGTPRDECAVSIRRIDMRQHKWLRVLISSWVLALAVSVVPVDSVVGGGPFGDPAPINEQTNPDPNGCAECRPQ